MEVKDVQPSSYHFTYIHQKYTRQKVHRRVAGGKAILYQLESYNGYSAPLDHVLASNRIALHKRIENVYV